MIRTSFCRLSSLFAALTMVPAAVFAQDQPAATAPESGQQQSEAGSDTNAPLPAKFDLREYGHVTGIRAQSGGTCWTHGTMAAIESNLLKTGLWNDLGYSDEPNFAEYHLDWWNGFNDFVNEDYDGDDEPGMTIHQGGDYRVAAAYIARGDGIVYTPNANDDNYRDRLWYAEAPNRRAPDYEKFYVRNIEWFVLGAGLENLDRIKQRIVDEGAVATCYASSRAFLSEDFIHYQPHSSDRQPNHAVAIVGWDDDKITNGSENRPPLPGAWLIKNSWGNERGEDGYYWISYFDKHACQHVELGAVSFREIEPLQYNRFYSHDYHGWRGTMDDVKRAFNAFTAEARDEIQAVSFYTAADAVAYHVKIFDRFEDGLLLDEIASEDGTIAVSGFHTVNLGVPVTLEQGDEFFVYLELSHGGQPIDRTSEIPVLLGAPTPGPNGPTVISTASPGESFYHDGQMWRDLYEYDFDDPEWATFDQTANFCIKAIGRAGERQSRRRR